MDELLKEDTVNFIDKIKTSEVYLNYINSKNHLETKPNLKAQVDEFRKTCFEIQTCHNYGYYNSYEQLVNLKNVNDELLSNPLVKGFLDDELKLTKLISKVFTRIAGSLDFNIDFLD